MTAAELYAARIDAVNTQRERLRSPSPGDRWGGAARRFRADPARELDPNLAVIASYVEPDDVFVDVGGGAGRVCLPLARRCTEVIDVDPSPAMQAEFEASAAEAGIANARFALADWLSAGDVRGDVCLAANVTYFMREIVRFVEKMEEAAARRVMITVWSVPPPAMDGRLFALVYDEEELKAPGHRELLPVLWEMGILPDVRVLPGPWTDFLAGAETREQAVTLAADRISPGKPERARPAIEANFDALFAHGPDGYRPLWRPAAKELLITWESRRRPTRK
jgi:SAM-dependent methyltransferase